MALNTSAQSYSVEASIGEAPAEAARTGGEDRARAAQLLSAHMGYSEYSPAARTVPEQRSFSLRMYSTAAENVIIA